MNVLITGGCGFIGSNLAVTLSEDGHEVVCFDNLLRRGSEILLDRVLKHGCQFAHGDIRSSEDLERLPFCFDLMIECSAEPSVLVGSKGADARFMVNNNLVGSVNCFEYSRKNSIPTIFLSTSRVYPYNAINALKFEENETRFELAENAAGVSFAGISIDFPLAGVRSLYGATKLSSEMILQEYAQSFELPCIINRCGVVAGPWQLGKVDQGVFTYWLVNHHFKRALQYLGFGGTGKQVRDLLHIADLAALIRKQMSVITKYRGKIFNVGGGRHANLSLQETTTLCRQITSNEVSIQQSGTSRPADVIWYITDSEGTEKEFGWKAERTPLEILQDTHSWLVDNQQLITQIFGK